MPSKVEERDGGLIEQDFGPNMDSKSRITSRDPPRRFTADSDDMGPNAPTTATAWTVEARAGGTCVVRVVHSWFASTFVTTPDIPRSLDRLIQQAMATERAERIGLAAAPIEGSCSAAGLAAAAAPASLWARAGTRRRVRHGPRGASRA